MHNLYLIGIGGSGAKAVEAIVHAAAVGALPPSRIKAFFVDPDTANGSLDRAKKTFVAYREARPFFTGSGAFGSVLNLYDPDIWNPLPEHGTRSIESYFSYHGSTPDSERARNLMDALLSKEERELPLDRGFMGRPSIGAAVLGGTVDLDNEAPWAELYRNLEQDDGSGGGAHVLLAGSVFGGTGASGVPTIGNLLTQKLRKKSLMKIRLGAVLLLPYFRFPAVPNEPVQAVSAEFLPNTQIALDHYHDRQYLKVFQTMYLLGEHELSPVPHPSLGSADQRNAPHFVELLAALAAVDFLQDSSTQACKIASRANPAVLTWNDLPHPQARAHFGKFLRFSYAYLAAIEKEVFQFVRTGAANQHFLSSYFPAATDTERYAIAQQLGKVGSYCMEFLKWAGALVESSHPVKLDLFRADQFVQTVERNGRPEIALIDPLDPQRFDSLLLPAVKEGRSLKEIYQRLNGEDPKVGAAQGLARLVTKVWESC